MAFDFCKWYADAQELLCLLREAGGWFRRCNRNTICVTDDPTPETEQQRFAALDAKAEADGQTILYESDLIRIAQAKLREGVKELWPLLEPAYFNLRDFEAEGLGSFRCAGVALNELADRTHGWAGDVWFIANREKRSLNVGEWCDWMDKAGWLSNTVDALHARLTLEKSWLLNPPPPTCYHPRRSDTAVATQGKKQGWASTGNDTRTGGASAKVVGAILSRSEAGRVSNA